MSIMPDKRLEEVLYNLSMAVLQSKCYKHPETKELVDAGLLLTKPYFKEMFKNENKT